VSIYNYENKFQSIYERIDDPDIKKFIDTLKLSNYSTLRMLKYAYTLGKFKRIIGKPLRDATKQDIEKIVAEAIKMKPQTRDTELRIIKIFYRWLRTGSLEKSTPYPPEVAWIKSGIKRNEIKEPEILTEDEVKRMIDVANNLRDKAFIALLYEGGFRIGEILPAKIKDVSFDEYGARIVVSGKTGPRIVRLITSVPLLSQWLEVHPKKDDLEAPIWMSKPKKRISYKETIKHLKETAVKAGIQKRIYPHMFRHSATTQAAQFLTEYEMRIRFGWSPGSDTPSRYVHMKDIDNKIVSLYKGKEVEPPKPALLPIKCPKCGYENTPGMRYCGRCGSPLNPEEIEKVSVEAQKIKEYVEIINELTESMKQLKRKVNELKRDYLKLKESIQEKNQENY
jgi:integrase/recombinase XerD